MMNQELPANTLVISDELLHLPNEIEREYEIKLTALSEYIESHSLREELISILKDSTNANEVLYAAFYCLAIIYRRSKDITLLERLIFDHEYVFKNNHPTFSHVHALFLKEKGFEQNALYIIQKTYETFLKIPNNAGIVHNFAETVVQAYEESESSIKEIIKENWLFKADNAINQAIELDPYYAKYYCTKGRLLAAQSKYKEARMAIKRAIDIEDSKKKDYVIRLGNYQYYLLLVQSIESRELIDQQLVKYNDLINTTKKEIQEKSNENITKNLEYLIFFTAIMSFIIGTIQFANKQDINDSIKLIIVLFAALISVFSGFGFILHGFKKKAIPNIIVFLLGIIILGVMFFL